MKEKKITLPLTDKELDPLSPEELRAEVENVFGTLKAECFYLNPFKGRDKLKKAIKESDIHYYNNEQIRQKLKGPGPVEYRTLALKVA